MTFNQIKNEKKNHFYLKSNPKMVIFLPTQKAIRKYFVFSFNE